jgi:hypothetical protein
MPSDEIVYVTVDGVLQPLGYSQVCRVLFGLAARGYRYQLISLERCHDLADTQRVQRLESELATHGIEWKRQVYESTGNTSSAGRNLLRLGESLRSSLRRPGVRLVHARAYHSALMAMISGGLRGVPYLFDARGRWVDERLAGGRWFKHRHVEAAARVIERQLYTRAAGIVTLTQLHADDIVGGAFGRYTGAPLDVITTCADFSSFTLERRLTTNDSDTSAIPRQVRRRLADNLVLAFVGSTNASYRYTDSFALAAEILARRADTHLLVLTQQVAEFASLAQRTGLPVDRYTITAADHRDMPEWLSRIDWAIQLLNGDVAKRGSMPTKLAEFFAAGVRVLHFGCNAEVTRWVERAGSGYVLPALDADALGRAADFVVNSRADANVLATARERMHAHFALECGVDAYDRLLSQLLGGRHQTNQK